MPSPGIHAVHRRFFAVAFASLVTIGPAHAQGALSSGDATRTPRTPRPTRAAPVHEFTVPSARAEPRTAAIAMDGKLDDAAWKAATPVTEFTQTDPDEGQPASERTEVRFLFDDNALYVGARMFDKMGRNGIKTNLVRRDDHFNSDFFEIVIDGYHDHLSRAFFLLNPSGSKNDFIGIGNSCCDNGWDPVWEGVTSIDDEGWTAEIRIPLSQLRFSSDNDTWGLQVRRWIQRRQELGQWSFWKKNEPGGPSRFGHLEGLNLAKTGSRQIELLPYAVGKGEFVQAAAGDPFNKGSTQGIRAGLDLKYLVTSNLTLSATFNPDFGQVEVDPAVVNLSAFETFFPEKRPFFIEGSQIFGFGNNQCYFCSNTQSLQAFYSRRIGRAPTGADLAYGAGPYADVPDAATILGAAKIAGRTANGFTIGVLNAVTGEANARVQTAAGTYTSQIVEPLSNYFVGRLKKDLMSGNLVLGGIATSVIRKEEPEFTTRLASHAEFIGTDWRYTWGQRKYSFMGQMAMSSLEGDRKVITARQRSSARYFQRPDRGLGSDGLFTNRLDTMATTMRGGGAYARVGKDVGNWLWEGMVNIRTPGFETNDYSFLTTSDYLMGNANIVRNITKPGSWYRSIWMSAGAQAQRNFDGDVTDVQLPVYFQTQTPKYWFVNSGLIMRPSVSDDRMLRGGPVVTKPGSWFWFTNINSDQRKKHQFNFNGGYGSNTQSGWSSNMSLSADMRPTSNVRLSLGPSWNIGRSQFQYVQSVADPTATEFFGRRYVLAAIRQKSLGLDTRLNVTFSPTMTLQLYAQPFISSGEYLDFKEFDAPRTDNWSVYGKDRGTITRNVAAGGAVTYSVDPDGNGSAAPFTIRNPDFNFRSLRGNAVFRWEYLAGSTLFLAWTHSRAGSAGIGDFDFSRDSDALLALKPDNIFLVKATWWLTR